MKILDYALVGKITLAAGISALLQIILLILMFTVSRNLFGTMSDYFYALTPILVLPLLLVLPKFSGGQNMVVSQIARFLGIVGILIASLAQVILLFKVIDLKESIWGNLVGVGLIGIPVLFLTLINLKNTGLPTSFNWLGIVLGVAMVMGIFAGIFFLDEMHAVQNFTLQWSGVNPMIYPLVIFGMITQLFFPIWLLWTAQLILSGRLTI